MASRGKGALDRGKTAERKVVEFLKTVRLRNVRRLKAGEFTDKADIMFDGSVWHIDVKSRNTIAIQAWWREIRVEAEALGLKPMLIIHFPGEGSAAHWLCITELQDANIGWTGQLHSALAEPPIGNVHDGHSDRASGGGHPQGQLQL